MNNKIAKTFCTVLDDFLNDLYSSYPDPALYLLIQTTKTMSLARPEYVVTSFMTSVDDYKDKILDKDESFFLNGGLAENLQGSENSFLIEELNKITTIWNKPETSQKTKESIWKYLIALVKLGSKMT